MSWLEEAYTFALLKQYARFFDWRLEGFTLACAAAYRPMNAMPSNR